MKEAIRQRAVELGFEDCRVTTAQRPESGPRLEQWLAQGRHGEMGYLERNAYKRLDPGQVLAGARSIITLAVSYGTVQRGLRDIQPTLDTRPVLRSRTAEGGHSTLVSSTGLIARYARYQDYHRVIGARLKSLAEFVDDLGGAAARSLWYVDTGPLLERDLAQRAGLGFIGKHTNLISRKLGNWIFLAEIITTLELEPDTPETNRCGSCTRCIIACPTAAITGPFELDARRCISYLTIELRGPIPVEWRAAIGNRIFGCDDCLAVCPWNRFAKEGSMMRPYARRDLATPDLVELLALDEAAFKERFAGTPVLRIKRKGLLRNVCVALGNLGDETALAALECAAAEPEPLIAEHARWACEQIRARTKK